MPTQKEFREELRRTFWEAELGGQTRVEVKAGDLHRRIGGYPGRNHRMPICCGVMRAEMQAGDKIVQSPPSGNGARFVVRYLLPRDPILIR